MNYLLVNHQRSYNLSLSEGLLALTSLSGLPYAQRHWQLAEASPQHRLGHRIIAALEIIPVVGLLFATIERIIAFIQWRPEIFKVELQNARQYDVPGDQPAACTFHAVAAMRALSNRFDQVFTMICDGNQGALSTFQRNVILDRGLPFYQRVLNLNPDIVEGADFQQIRPHLPPEIPLHQPDDHDELGPFEARLNRVVAPLFAPNPATKMAWIKNGNEESFAVVTNGNRAIVFDSHRNQIVGTQGRQATFNALRDKLSPYVNNIDGNDATPFAYAVSN